MTTVGQELTKNDTFFNLGVSAANYYDILAQFGILKQSGKKIDRIILCVDSYFFDEKNYNTDSRAFPLLNYTNYMLSQLEETSQRGNLESPIQAVNEPGIYEKISQLFSVTYFQDSISVIRKRNSITDAMSRAEYVDSDFDYENNNYYKKDGSLVYSKKRNNVDSDFVVEDAKKYLADEKLAKGYHMNENNKRVFEKLVEYCINNGIKLDFFLCPLSPALWDRIQNEGEYYLLDELESFAKQTAQKYNLRLIGSYNPYNVGAENSDFFDSRHIKRDNLKKLFDFSKEAPE